MAGLFIKLDTNFWSHPKVVTAGHMAGVLYQQMAMYCMDHATDGLVPRAQLPRFGMPAAGKLIGALVAVELIEQHPDGWLVPGYVERYKTAAEVDELRAKRAAAGRQGGRPRTKELPADESTSKANCFPGALTARNPEEEKEKEEEKEGASSSPTSAARPPAPDDDDLPERLWARAGIARPGPTEGERRTVARATARGWQADQLLAKAARAATAEHDVLAYLRQSLGDAANSDPPTERTAGPATNGETRDSAWAAVRRVAATGNHAWGPDTGLSDRARTAARQVRMAIKGDTEANAKWAFFAAYDAVGTEVAAS